MEKKAFWGGVITGVLLTVITLQSSLIPSEHIAAAPAISLPSTDLIAPAASTAHVEATHTPAPASASASLVNMSDVMPADYDLGVHFGDTVIKMVQRGIIDKEKFIQVFAGRKALTKPQLQLLDTPSTASIVLNQENAGVLLNIFWPLGISNKSEVLSRGPLGTSFKDKAGNMASTGGWTLAKGDGAQYLNSISLVPLTAEQALEAADIAKHIYRPCCNNETYFPDCNHGAAMLGYIELAVAQGLPTAKVYKNALVLNAYWFQQNYTALATYMKAKHQLDWKDVNPEVALSATYSSGQGSGAVVAELQADGLLPKAKDSGGCGA
ncbi:MAG TPA: hypothetical protein VGK87_10725 [Anaerolineae bacterium]